MPRSILYRVTKNVSVISMNKFRAVFNKSVKWSGTKYSIDQFTAVCKGNIMRSKVEMSTLNVLYNSAIQLTSSGSCDRILRLLGAVQRPAPHVLLRNSVQHLDAGAA